MSLPLLLNAEPNGFCAEARQILQRFARVEELPLSQRELVQRIAPFHLLIVRLALEVDRQVLAAAPRLRAVATATTGLDHVDLDEARRRGVEVLSLKGETGFLETVPASGEFTWALLLALTRRLVEACASVRQGRWDRDTFRGRDLRGRRLGIVGLGRVGRQVARYGAAFEMRVRAFDPHPSAPWPPGVGRAETLDELLEAAEVLTLHPSFERGTQRLIGAPQLERLPAGAVLINTSRGGVLDEDALLAALQSGRLAGAALDVLDGEPLERVDGHPLVRYARERSNLLLTPHLAGASRESMEKTECFLAGKLERWWRQAAAEARS